MENLVNINPDSWRGRVVFLTGHTGFKGGWLALWLQRLGAVVHGYALDPPGRPNLFEAAAVCPALAADTRADLADLAALKAAMRAAAPEVVFHLAAQPLVRESYRDPLGTLMSNVMGSAHVMEAARECPGIRAIVMVTTDKVYLNLESVRPYHEDDPLGGYDPYSASKAAAEIVSSSYRSSFFTGTGGHPARIATARAGNVIGGGDWAQDRLVPDCLRAFGQKQPVRLRYPGAVRPWQHVLEPLSGYLVLAQHLLSANGNAFAGAWNFGPDAGGNATVGEVAGQVADLWGGAAEVLCEPSENNPHEAGLLSLDNTKARELLGWSPRWPLRRALQATVGWHQAWLAGADLHALCGRQMDEYLTTPPA